MEQLLGVARGIDRLTEAVGKAARSEAWVMIRAFDHKVAMLVGAACAAGACRCAVVQHRRTDLWWRETT